MDEAVICPKCGCLVGDIKALQKNATNTTTAQTSGLKTAAKILMIISCVIMGFWIITLAWTLPMTINYCNKVKNGQPISVGFKICILLFINTIAGILLLCDNEN